MADIFVSYTSKDQRWAFWIGKELKQLGHHARIHEWELPAGGNILAWMEETLKEADRALFVISNAYLNAPFSSWERMAAQWAGALSRPNFFLPVFIENCEPPMLLAPFKRCVLYGLGEGYARNNLSEYLAPPKEPAGPVAFPGELEAANALLASTA